MDHRASDVGGEDGAKGSAAACGFCCCSVQGTEDLRQGPLCYFFSLRDPPKRRHTTGLAM